MGEHADALSVVTCLRLIKARDSRIRLGGPRGQNLAPGRYRNAVPFNDFVAAPPK